MITGVELVEFNVPVDKELITKTSQLNERDFIIRMLYKNCY